MDTNSKKLLEALPDFSKFFELAEEIKNLSYEKMVIESLIKQAESNTFTLVMTDSRYFINGKAPSVAYFENAYKQNGVDGGLVKIRMDLARVVSELDLKKIQYDVYKQMLDMWRTMSANERNT